MEVIAPSNSFASALSVMVGSRSTKANTLLALASPFCNWLTSIPKMNIGMVILVEINRKVTNCPVVISPDLVR